MSQQKLSILKTTSLRAGSDNPLGVCHCSARLSWTPVELGFLCRHPIALPLFCSPQLVLGPSGVLQGIRPGKCYVDMSTVDADTVTELAQVITELNLLTAAVHSAAVLQFVLLQALLLLVGNKTAFRGLWASSQVPGKQDKITCQILTSKWC